VCRGDEAGAQVSALDKAPTVEKDSKQSQKFYAAGNLRSSCTEQQSIEPQAI
jgi:hypothetical protein